VTDVVLPRVRSRRRRPQRGPQYATYLKLCLFWAGIAVGCWHLSMPVSVVGCLLFLVVNYKNLREQEDVEDMIPITDEQYRQDLVLFATGEVCLVVGMFLPLFGL